MILKQGKEGIERAGLQIEQLSEQQQAYLEELKERAADLVLARRIGEKTLAVLKLLLDDEVTEEESEYPRLVE